MNLDEVDEAELKALAQCYSGLSYWVRLSILIGLQNDRSLNDIADIVDITRGGMQGHIEKLLEADLIYRPEESDLTYKISPLGDYFLERLESELGSVPAALETLEEARKKLREENSRDLDILSKSELVDEGDVQDRVDDLAWDSVIEDIQTDLEEDQ